MNPAVIGVVGLMLCVSSSAAAAMMGGGEEKEDPTTAATGTGAATGPSSTGPSSTATGAAATDAAATDAATTDAATDAATAAAATATVRDEATPENDFAGGSMIYLDRHNVDCKADGLTGFSLDMKGTDKMLYNYKCRDGIGGTLSAEKNSGPNDWGGNNVIYLDRHTLDCGKKPINQFKLYRPNANQIAYKYKCNETEAKGDCTEREVISTVTGKSNNTATLIEADPQCQEGEVLTKFKHFRANANTPSESAGYKYTCCKM
jgi:hypothetical protein